MENVIMMISNAGDVNFKLAQKENKHFTTCKEHINHILNDS